ncbi:hypothetical protein E3O62_06385 [Cryobacterium sp. TMT2-15-1]|nr:hypothetical protein E3O62_06385 [Cryobacterium sp. TMT2-15-1]
MLALAACGGTTTAAGEATTDAGGGDGVEIKLIDAQQDLLSFPSNRDPLKWPFRQDSIWNLPLSDSAVYLPADIGKATEWGMTTDEDLIILTPDAPLTDVFTNYKDWSPNPDGNLRCAAEGPLLTQLPIPAEWTNDQPAGTTPNASAAVLKQDGLTLFQTQPLHRCTAGGYATSHYVFNEMNIKTGDGIEGSHGGSRMSSIGGSVRMGELAPGGVIRHALKINLFGKLNLFCASGESDGKDGYRWPALASDSGACSGVYGGTNPALQQGSLLALRPDFDAGTLETEPARIVASALRDYGAYVVDDTGWNVYALMTERGPAGDVAVEFNQTWGFELAPQSRDNAWSRDMDRIFGVLNVVDNSAPSTPGGGPLNSTRRQPLAPAFE